MISCSAKFGFMLIGIILLQVPFIQAQVPDAYNVVWDSQSADASESMPLVGGDMACNVWVEDGDLLFYLQRSGSLTENGEYLKMGRFRIQLFPNPFCSEIEFTQELNLQQGFIEIIAGQAADPMVNIKLWIDVFHPVLHCEVSSRHNIELKVAYENWRTKDKELRPVQFGRERFTCFSLEGYPGKVIRVKDEVEYTPNGVEFYHKNPADKLIPEMLISLQGLDQYADEIYDDLENRIFGGVIFGEDLIPDGKGSGTYQITPFKSWKLKSARAKMNHHVMVATNIEQAASLVDWRKHLENTAHHANTRPQLDWGRTKDWWHDFWNRSYICIFPENPDPDNLVWQMSRNYQLFRYQLGGNTFGEFPTKFNGGSLNFDPVLVSQQTNYEPDWRQWGGAVHTAQNQRLLYWPMLKAGDFDAILPQFELYRKGLPGATARVKAHFGHEGAVFPEYMATSGIVFGAGWGWEGTGHRARGEEIPFGDIRATGATGYNQTAEKGVMANQSCAYHWESQLEHAYMMLEYHRYSGQDIATYMPFIKAAVLFFDEHYQLRESMRSGRPLDQNGKLVIYPSTSCESYRGATNPTDILAGLQACIQGLLELDTDYVGPVERQYYKEFKERIPDYSMAMDQGRQIFKPAESWLKEANQELPQFYPLFPFNQFGIGDDAIEVFKNTYELAPDFRKGKVMSWHQDGIFFARMGMTQHAADYNVKKLQDSDRRFPTFWGPGHDWVPDHNWGGSGMIGLQEMLMQTKGDEILLFPAWPAAWDVDFKLHAPYNTIVEGVLRNGELIELKVTPESRKNDLVIIDFN